MKAAQHFHDFIKHTKGIFLLAVSGGIDSIVMAHLFKKQGLNFAIAHCNFQLRGDESDKDENFVTALAVNMDVPLYIKKFNTHTYAEDNKVSIQMAARDLRYDWFEEILLAGKFDYLVTAHHSGDQAETILLNLIKGKGLKAMAGIAARKEKILRPLLGISRKDIENYASENNLQWREDESNNSIDYERNFLRWKVIPLLHEINPSLENTLSNVAGVYAESSEYIETAIEDWKQKNIKQDKELVKIDVASLKNHPLKLSILYHIFSPLHFVPATVRLIADHLSAQPGTLFESSTHEARMEREEMIIHPKKRGNKTEYLINEPVDFNCEYFSMSFQTVDKLTESENPFTACFDAGELTFPLTIRHWQPGDRFTPLGMEGSQKISDFFTNIKIPDYRKQEAWLVISGGEIAWIAGFRTGHRFRVREESKTILKITFAVH